MKHESTTRDGLTIDRFTDDAAGLRIEAVREGAELVSMARRDAGGAWHGCLYRDGDVTAPESGWANHATVMGYYLHRLLGGRSLYRGREIVGGTHSFLRQKMFDAPRVLADGLAYSLDPSQIEPQEYPLKVAFELRYRLVDGAVRVEFEFENRETESAHVSFGLHPGFAVQQLDEARVILPAGDYARHLSPGNFLSGETVPFHHDGGALAIPRVELLKSLLIEVRETENRVVTVEDPANGQRVEIDLSEPPYFTIWSDGGPFICVEPCWGLADHHEQRPFEKKQGIQEIAPGGRLSASFWMRPEVGS